MTDLIKFYENTLSDPHSFVFVLIGYFIVLGTCAYAVIKTLKEIIQYRKQIKQITLKKELSKE
ncbi:hypothetical protein FAI41_07875 [Acetobacteraceae bacterium]|nr:hypothetical protein FAI41_07875 [Acetobacteraceae bacterium]